MSLTLKSQINKKNHLHIKIEMIQFEMINLSYYKNLRQFFVIK